MQLAIVEIRHCSEDLHSCSVFSECLFRSINNDNSFYYLLIGIIFTSDSHE